MSKVAILVIEDNFLSRRLVKKALEKEYEVIEVDEADEVSAAIENNNVRLAIIDINLGTSSEEGIRIANEIKEKYGIPFIYLTAYDSTDITRRALATEPSSYISKPFTAIDLLASIEIALSAKVGKDGSVASIQVQDENIDIALPVNSIDYVEAIDNYLFIHAGEKKYKHHSTLKNMQEILPPDQFIQVHPDFVVRREKISKYDNSSVMVGDAVIPVSKKIL